MSSDVKILRLSTGEDVIAKVGENDQGVSLNKSFVIIPQQSAGISFMLVLEKSLAASIKVLPSST